MAVEWEEYLGAKCRSLFLALIWLERYIGGGVSWLRGSRMAHAVFPRTCICPEEENDGESAILGAAWVIAAGQHSLTLGAVLGVAYAGWTFKSKRISLAVLVGTIAVVFFASGTLDIGDFTV